MKVLIVSGTRNALCDMHDLLVCESVNLAGAEIVIHGNCESGVDAIVDEFCSDTDEGMILPRATVLPCPAQWDRLGKRAGPIRNSRMVEVGVALADGGHDVSWIAFPQGVSRGTRDFIKKAQDAGLPGKVVEL